MADPARLVLTGGPFDGEEVATVAPDLTAPIQIVWSGWTLGGFTAWLYEWHGDTTTIDGRTDTLVYRATGRRLSAAEIPYLMSQGAEIWADAADMLISMNEGKDAQP